MCRDSPPCSDLSPLLFLTLRFFKTGLPLSNDLRVAGTVPPPRQSVTADKKQISQPEQTPLQYGAFPAGYFQHPCFRSPGSAWVSPCFTAPEKRATVLACPDAAWTGTQTHGEEGS